MSNLRVPFAVAGGALLTSAVFLALYQLVSGPLNFVDPLKATEIQFTRQRVDTPLENKRDPKIVRPPPQVVLHDPTTITTESGGFDRAVFIPPKIAVGVLDDKGLVPGTDRDVIPIVRPAPDYPPRALTRGLEGWVRIQFVITSTGTVRDPVVVAAEPQGIFEDAALKAIARWRYNPRVEGGVAVDRVGLQTVIKFELHD